MNISVKAKIDEMGIDLDHLSAGVIESFKLAVGQVATEAHHEWLRRSQQRRVNHEYINGLQKANESFVVERSATRTVYRINLVGKLANMLEFGFPSFDMKEVKPGWLWGKKSKEGKDGKRYVTIPFRHTTARRSNIRYSGKARQAGLMGPGRFENVVKQTAKQYGLHRMKRSAGVVVRGVVGRVPRNAPVHPYLRGLTRIQQPHVKTRGRTGSSQLMTFRTMSEKSPASSWVHPGYEGVKLLPEIERFVNQQLESKLRELVRA